MFSDVVTGLAWGLFLGLLAGLANGIVEGARILQAASGRSGAQEAALYALIVNAVSLTALFGVLGGFGATVLAVVGLRLQRRTLAAVYASAAVALAFFIARILALFPARKMGAATGAPSDIVFTLAVAALIGIALFPVLRAFSWRLLGSARRAASLALASSLVLSLIVPLQLAVEIQGHLNLGRGSAAAVDLDRLSPDLAANLEAWLDQAMAEGLATSDQPPNILLITVDALRADHVGACGNEWIETPWLDLLARHSTISCNAYTQQPQTNPALASLFTSTYPAVHGVRLHMVDRLPDSFDTLAEVLRARGYATGAILPWTALEPAFSGFHQGFQVYEAYVVNEPEAYGNPIVASIGGVYRRVTDQVGIGGAIESVLGLRQQVEAEIDGRADVTAAAAMEWLSRNRQQPFFLWVHFFDPHYPWTAPEPWSQLYTDDTYDGPYDGGMGFVYAMREGVFEPTARDIEHLRAMYASEVSFTDHYIGQLLGYVAQQGLLRNTVVALTSDHGESLGEHGTTPEGDNWLHGDDLYSTGIRVPFILFDPGLTHPGQVLAAPVQHIDIMPTLLDLAGAPIPPVAQGRSLIPLIAGQEEGLTRYAVTTLADDRATAIVTADGWKLISHQDTGKRELYNLVDDPLELADMSGSLPGRTAELTALLDEWARTGGDRGFARRNGPSG